MNDPLDPGNWIYDYTRAPRRGANIFYLVDGKYVSYSPILNRGEKSWVYFPKN